MADPMSPPVATPPGMPGQGMGGPVEGDMTTPQPNAGEQAHADVNVRMAMQMLEGVLPVYGASSDKGRTVLKVLSALGGQFGESEAKSKELVPAEIMSMMQALPAGSQGAGAGPQ